MNKENRNLFKQIKLGMSDLLKLQTVKRYKHLCLSKFNFVLKTNLIKISIVSSLKIKEGGAGIDT